ncbi:MAG: class II aldolase/adducin family protein [Pseudomonadota bacterium]
MCTIDTQDDAAAGEVASSAAPGAPGPAPGAALVADLVSANHILSDRGVVDAFGHVSVRHDGRTDRFLMSRNMAPALVGAGDILEFDLHGQPHDARGRAVYLERFIHAAIYRARPDVMAVVHSHSLAVLPFCVVQDAPLRAVYHMGSFLGTGAPVFEIRKYAGDGSDMLVRSPELGAALADELGSGAVILMRGHGSTVAAASLPLAVYMAVYTEVNARIQADAMRLGPVTYLSAAEAAAADINIGKQVERPWALWKAQAAQHRLLLMPLS